MPGATVVTRTDNAPVFDWDDARLYWLASHGVGPAALWLWERGVGEVVVIPLEAPVVGFVGRPDPERRRQVDDLAFVRTWITGPSRDLAFARFPDFFLVDGRVDYRASSRLGLRLDLSLHTTPDPVRTVALRYLFGAEWRPGR